MKISILMSNYNNAKFVVDSIESVINQSVDNWELLICDDCSDDNSINMISPYLNDSKIRLLKNTTNIGTIGTLKRLIKEAQHEIVGILDSDDTLTKTAVYEILQPYIEDKDVGFVYSSYMVCDRHLKPYFKPKIEGVSKNRGIMHIGTVSHFKTFLKTSYNKTSGIDESCLYAEDIDLIYKLEEVSKTVFVNSVLYNYRFLKNSQSHDLKKREIGKQNSLRALSNAYQRRLHNNTPSIKLNDLLNRIKQSNDSIDIYSYMYKLPYPVFISLHKMHFRFKGKRLYDYFLKTMKHTIRITNCVNKTKQPPFKSRVG